MKLPSPKNTLVTIINIVIDGAITGLGADKIIAGAVIAAPWLAYPVISNLFNTFVGFYARKVDLSLAGFIDTVVIRFQSNVLQKKIDALEEQLRSQKEMSDAELAKANAVIDSFINRSR